MAYKIFLDSGFSGEHMGLIFAHGEAHTEDAFLATRLRSKGYRVTDEAVADDEAVSDQGEAAEVLPDIDFSPDIIKAENITIAQLKEYAAKNHISLGSARTKAEIMEAISCEIGNAAE